MKLRSFRIAAVFVFDGKPPEEKQEEIVRRFERKSKCHDQYDALRSKYESSPPGPEKHRMKYELEKLKRQFVRLSPADISLAKDLLVSCGHQVADAPGESDAMCARMVQVGAADACLSEDTDMFPFGCPLVLRNLSLADSTVLIYDLNSILNDLGLSFNEFKEVCVTSGCDYNLTGSRGIGETMRLMKDYKAREVKCSFLDWLSASARHDSDLQMARRALALFDTSNVGVPETVVGLRDVDGPRLTSVLAENGFLFAD
jgi:flap endonuclease-1